MLSCFVFKTGLSLLTPGSIKIEISFFLPRKIPFTIKNIIYKEIQNINLKLQDFAKKTGSSAYYEIKIVFPRNNTQHENKNNNKNNNSNNNINNISKNNNSNGPKRAISDKQKKKNKNISNEKANQKSKPKIFRRSLCIDESDSDSDNDSDSDSDSDSESQSQSDSDDRAGRRESLFKVLNDKHEDLCERIESALFDRYKGITKAYNLKFRDIKFNLRNTREFRKSVIDGNVTPYAMVRMSNDEMASASLKKKVKAMKGKIVANQSSNSTKKIVGVHNGTTLNDMKDYMNDNKNNDKYGDGFHDIDLSCPNYNNTKKNTSGPPEPPPPPPLQLPKDRRKAEAKEKEKEKEKEKRNKERKKEKEKEKEKRLIF